MRIQSAMLCDATVITGNKLYVLGAGIGTWTVPTFPSVVSLTVALVLETDPDLGVAGDIEIAVANGAGAEMPRASIHAEIHDPGAPMAPWVSPAWARIDVPVEHPGLVEVLLGLGGSIDIRLPIAILGPR